MTPSTALEGIQSDMSRMSDLRPGLNYFTISQSDVEILKNDDAYSLFWLILRKMLHYDA